MATTDDRGIYRFGALQPGRYFVAVLSVQATVPSRIADGVKRQPLGALESSDAPPPSPTPSEALGASVDVGGDRHRLVLTNYATPPPPGSDQPRVYAPVFYPEAAAPDAALPVELGFGISRTNIDFQLVPVAAVRISGRVTGAIGDVANMFLRLMPRGSEHLGFGSEAATTLVEPDGSFTFLNVPRGNYTLVASSQVAEVRRESGSGRLPAGSGYGVASLDHVLSVCAGFQCQVVAVRSGRRHMGACSARRR